MSASTTALRLVGAIKRADARTCTTDDFFAEVSAAVAKDVPFDGSMWFGVDPGTLLASAPARIQNMDSAYCWPFWHAEFNDSDLMLFRDLARAPLPVASLRLTTHGKPLRSARYREFMQPQGYEDEARIAFRTGTTTWAVAGLYREKGRAPFEASELQVLSSISTAVGSALRARSVQAHPGVGPLDAPGVMMFAPNGVLQSANSEAKLWLGHLYGPHADGASWTELHGQDTMAEELFRYPIMQSLVSRARAVAMGFDEGPARLRLRDQRGRWVVLHASCLDSSAADGAVVVVVEPAQSSEIAPIIVDAYGLSPRERDVVRGIARGLSTPEIAADLFLSGHTVRDYIKSVFEKVGVNSRGELIAKLFAEHYADAMHDAAVHV